MVMGSFMNRELIKSLILAAWGTLVIWVIVDNIDKPHTIVAPTIYVTPEDK
jgi:hypothetical protein